VIRVVDFGFKRLLISGYNNIIIIIILVSTNYSRKV